MLIYRNSLKNDILGALDVNMFAIWLTNSNNSQEIYKRNNLYVCEGKIEVLLKHLLDNTIKNF
ncbi:hypothetical protein JCM2421_01690 [Staphylococcus auricularis]|nr:hypothetical protein JCM2421_01690 [Staphylococcus auricularis]